MVFLKFWKKKHVDATNIKEKKIKKRLSIFRKKRSKNMEKDTTPLVQPALTYTLSQDSACQIASPSNNDVTPQNHRVTAYVRVSPKSFEGVSNCFTFGVNDAVAQAKEKVIVASELGGSQCPMTLSKPNKFVVDASQGDSNDERIRNDDIVQYADAVLTNLVSPKAKKISSLIFTEEDLMNYELNHMRQLQEKHQTIEEMQVVMVEIKEKFEKTKGELLETKGEVESLDRELCEAYEECTDLEDELRESRVNITEKQEEMNLMGATLIQCQHELEERKLRAERSLFSIWC